MSLSGFFKQIGYIANPFNPRSIPNSIKHAVQDPARQQKAALNSQMELTALNRKAVVSEQEKAQKRAEQERTRLNASIARANKSRKAGGLFGDSEVSAGSSPTLG